MYQTNSPPKLVTSKTFFSLTWSSPPKSSTPPEEWHLILKFLPLFDTIVKRHKKQKDMTGDRQKTNIEGMRRTRNHRPTRKRKTRCYGHKGKKKCKTNVRTYVSHLIGTYVTTLCNWLILWQNSLYLYFGRSRICLILQETVFQDQVLKTCKSVQDSSWRRVVY